ncbi:glucanohydrolase [Anoxybacillus gonensis]|uniref:NERD domain-containing protein n=1 Tax=Anoxybacillus gonensis TaxID=198467 RepID=A0AAW7TG20_9BACL|nr:hypothetical protein [Anoxybacillus gonensis]AXM89435.1 glucanohydrolase [Anoxybacillus ayderensis G10]MBW9217563.1 NERD domain-containing protein [Anoxybacillus sp. ST70]MCX8002919.1 NERD domain-containing protein [Anoxybacillus mongoliensis]THD16774.1 glucanohydrolase [Anoxybacillus ayderensis]AKS39287.1 glucanohydrolase [Anoxybacillus gonensis]
MGQLIKLQDYISRYELDIYHYPSEFIRLKKKQWERMKQAWETGQLAARVETHSQQSWKWLEEETSLFDKVKQLWKRKKVKDIEVEDEQPKEEEEFFVSITSEPRTLEELKILFLEKLFQLQIRWASSTLTEESIIDPKYYYDVQLKYFLQRFPDTYLCMYKPVFLLKKAPVELNTIFISPTTTWCIAFTEERKNNIVVGSAERFWTEIVDEVERKIVNPMISLHRTEKVVQTIYKQFAVDMPIKKVLINREGYIDYRYAPSDLEIIDRRHYETWFMSLRQLTMPLKHMQLKAAQSLLTYCDARYYDPLVVEELEEADE